MVKYYSFSEYRQLQDLNTIERFLHQLKKNKKEYAKLVFLLAVTMPKPVFALNNDYGLSDVAYEIIHMVLVFGRYGCLGMGVKAMIENMLQGANIREATSEGLQYFIFYIVLNIYPRLFNMIKF